MRKKTSLILGAIIAAVSIGIIVAFTIEQPLISNDDEGKQHDYVTSGPVSVTQYKHRLGDDVFLVVSGLQPNEKDTLHIFTPKGVEYKTIPYDGSKKSNFKQYFYPDTFATLKICTPEDLVGIWKIVFEDGSYSTLEFEITDEWVAGAEASIKVEC